MSLYSDVQGTDRRKKEKDQVGRFHARQALSMLLVFTILFSAFFIMLAKQYNLGRRHKKEILLKHFKERVAHLDNLLARVTEHVDGLRIVSETDLLQSRAIKVLNQPLEFKNLTDVADEKRYHLDTFKPPITRQMIGNLTGHGSIRDHSRDFYREIHMALILNPLFRAAAVNSAWVYYTSRNNFVNIYPWVSSKDFKFSKKLYTHEFYSFGLPENNPDRKRFWTKVYVDEYGKGLMTTCAAPIYDQNRFMGTVAIDITVDFLNAVVQKFNPGQGVMFLINDRDQLLAHPTLITSGDKRTKTLNETLPETLRSSIDRLIQIPDTEITRMGSFNILRSQLHQAPWQVIYIEHARSFWNSFLDLIGVGPAMILAMLFVLVITVFVVTHRQFLLPSKKFVNYIMTRSQRIQAQMDHRIPRVWEPWFSAVEKVFAENEKLTKELQEQNVNLEQRVKQRTAELAKINEQLKQEIEERRQAEKEREKLINELQGALMEIKTLRGILPLCSFCKKIRDDKGYWEQVDVYIHKHSQADISHSICPECAKKHYPDLDI
jgi:hypothetical protein